MKHTLILAGAIALTIGASASGVRAETIYSTTAPASVTTTTSGHEVVNKTYTAVGTRKVGMVGSKPYPMQASHIESKTVVNRPMTTETISYAPRANDTATTSSSTTTVSTSDTPISYSTGGGNYYTEDGAAYYNNPALNINVRRTGSFND